MANPIKTSDLYEDSGELKKLIAELEQVQQELKTLKEVQVDSANELNKTLKKVNATTSAQRDAIEGSAKQAEEIKKRYDKYNESLSKNAVKIEALKAAQRDLNKVNKLEAKILSSKEGSYDRLSAQYSINKIRLNKMSEAERKNTKAGKELVKVTNEIYQEMKVLQEETGKHSLSVGDYEKATTGLIERLEEMPSALGETGNSLNSLNKGFKVISKNPFIFLLSIIVSGILALGNAFRSSEKGARLFETATAILDGLFLSLIDLSAAVAESIEYAFKNPLQTVKNLGSAIVENIVNRVKGLGLLMIETGTIIKESLTLNFDEAEAAAKRAAEAVIQISTGLDADQQKENALLDFFKDLKKKVDETVDSSVKLDAERLQIQRSNRLLAKSVEKLATEEAILKATADDTTKSFKEREKAAQEARKSLEEKNLKEIQIAKNNLSLIKGQISLQRSKKKDVEQLLDQELQAYSALEQAERELTLSRLDNERTRNELRQDRLERDLDILIDGFDNQKTINERLIADDTLTFEKRKQLLQETVKLSNDSFEKQIETIQKFTGVSVNANELISESDAVVLNEKIRSLGLSEIIEGRLLEIVRDRKSANQDLAESEKELNAAVKKNAEDQLKFRQQLIAKSKKAYEDFQKSIYEGSLRTFEQQQELEKSEFDLLESTEEEKTRFVLNAEKERILKLIQLNKISTEKLSEDQLETFKNQVKKIEQELEKVTSKQSRDIYDLLGFNLTDENKTALTESLSFVKSQFSDLANTRVQLAGQNVENTNNEVAASQRQLDIEIANRQAGLADKVETAQKELAAAKRNQEQALNEQRKAQKAQQRIQSIEQSINLITASSNILKTLPFPFSIAAIALMFGSFAAAKIKAAKLTKKTFGKGGLEFLAGGSHASGNDTYLGFQSEGKPAFGEAGEAVAIIPKKTTKKYKTILPSLVDSLRKGTFEKNFMSINGSHGSDGADIYIQKPSSGGGLTDVSRMENDLSAIRKNGERSFSTNSKGQTVVRYKNLTRTYV